MATKTFDTSLRYLTKKEVSFAKRWPQRRFSIQPVKKEIKVSLVNKWIGWLFEM